MRTLIALAALVLSAASVLAGPTRDCPKGYCSPGCPCVEDAKCGTPDGCPIVRPYPLPPPLTPFAASPCVNGQCPAPARAAPMPAALTRGPVIQSRFRGGWRWGLFLGRR